MKPFPDDFFDAVEEVGRRIGRKLRISFLPFCPYCLRDVLQPLHIDLDRFEKYDLYRVAWGGFLPDGRELAEKVGYRYFIYPICWKCTEKLDSASQAVKDMMSEVLEENLVAIVQSGLMPVIDGQELRERGVYHLMELKLTFIARIGGSIVLFAPAEKKSRVFIEEVFNGRRASGEPPDTIAFYSRRGGEWEFDMVKKARRGRNTS